MESFVPFWKTHYYCILHQSLPLYCLIFFNKIMYTKGCLKFMTQMYSLENKRFVSRLYLKAYATPQHNILQYDHYLQEAIQKKPIYQHQKLYNFRVLSSSGVGCIQPFYKASWNIFICVLIQPSCCYYSMLQIHSSILVA